MPASRLASCAATKASVARPSRAFAILVSGSPSTVESREASALVSALPARAASRAAVQESGRYLRVHLRGSVNGREQGVRCQGAGVRLGGLQPRDGGVSACKLGGQRHGSDGPRRALATLVSTSSGVILAAMSRECWSTTVLRP